MRARLDAFGDRPGTVVATGIALAIVAIVLLGQESTHPEHPASSPPRGGLPAGMWHALASGVAIGCFFLLVSQARTEAGLWPLVAARCAGVPFFAALAVTKGASFRLPRTLVVAHVQPLNAKKMEERYRNSPACAIIC